MSTDAYDGRMVAATAAIDAMLRTLREARWLSPDASLVEGRQEARFELEALAQELFAALRSGVPSGVSQEVVTVVTTHSLSEFYTAWREAWRDWPENDRSCDALSLSKLASAALEARRGSSRVSQAQRGAWDAALSEAWLESLSRNPVFSAGAIDSLCPAVMLVARQIEWLLDGREGPSPFDALWRLWLLGVWPAILPSGRLLCFVRSSSLDPASLGPPEDFTAPLALGILGSWEWLAIGATALAREMPTARFVFDGVESEWLSALCVVGRSTSSEIVLRSVTVSKQHGRILLRRAGFVLTDTSASGTFYNRARVARQTVLAEGEYVFGAVAGRLVFSEPSRSTAMGLLARGVSAIEQQPLVAPPRPTLDESSLGASTPIRRQQGRGSELSSFITFRRNMSDLHEIFDPAGSCRAGAPAVSLGACKAH
jgi:hypothetical protein